MRAGSAPGRQCKGRSLAVQRFGPTGYSGSPWGKSLPSSGLFLACQMDQLNYIISKVGSIVSVIYLGFCFVLFYKLPLNLLA